MLPTVTIYIDGSWITRDERGEIIETVDTLEDGTPDWSSAGICDHRGGGGEAGFKALHLAFEAAELNAELLGCTIERITL